jgi:hypothetical protein
MVAVGFTALVGTLGLAAEGGVWYLASRNASTAADLAALAGATAREIGQPVAAAAADIAARNGFPHGGRIGVTIRNPPETGSHAGDMAAVEVVITQRQEMRLAGMFLDSAPTIRRRAVAVSNVDEQVCLLALGGGLELGGNSTTHATRCALAANAAAPGGIRIFGSASVRAAALVTTGTCSGCTTGDVWADAARTQRPAVMGGRPNPVTDPFAGLQGWTPSPPACRTGAVTFTDNKATLSPGSAICENLTVGTRDHLHLEPGLYYLDKNADLTVQGKITGDGVTLVLTGDADRVGTIRINAQATGSLRGPATSLIPGHPEAAGLVAYRDARATNNGSQKEVQLNGGATMRMFGGLYFPSSDVVVNGNSGIGYSSCLGVVGFRLSFSGSSDTDVDVSGCAGFAPYATLRTVRLVE